MLKRMLVGLVKGAVLGGLLGAAVVFGLGMPVLTGWMAHVAAAVTGALTGLLAGRAVWEKDARIEAGLKAGVGALIGAAALFAIRKWLNVTLDLGSLGRGAVGDLPLAALPLIATALAVFFEIDNTGETSPPSKKTRVAGAAPRALGEDVELDAALDEEHATEEPRRATRR